jgi:hypothetical protein
MGTLRTVVLDEIHLLQVEHGLSFRRDIFFLPVFHPKDEGRWKPKFLGLTATLPTDYYRGVRHLTALPLPPASIFHGKGEDFINEDITMKQVIIMNKGDYVKIGLTRNKDH